MNTIQENKLTMYRTTERYLLSNASIITPLPNYAISFIAFQKCLRLIGGYKQVQEMNSGGLAEQKQQRRDHLATIALDVAGKLKAYATFGKHTVLLREIDYSDSSLKQAAANVFIDRTKIILQRAQEQVGNVAEYRITPELLDQLQNAVTEFEASITDPRMGAVMRKGATEALENCFVEADQILKKKIDVIVGMVRTNEPAFYAGYLNARMTLARKNSRSNASRNDLARQMK